MVFVMFQSDWSDKFMGLVGDVLGIDKYKQFFVHPTQIILHPDYEAGGIYVIMSTTCRSHTEHHCPHQHKIAMVYYLKCVLVLILF